jgi:beta-carotene 3-hydroxylase
VGMELVAWFTHKYIMHGWLWSLHKDHHTGSKHILEHNDWFSLFFAVPSFLLILFGFIKANSIMISLGFGMTAYGAAYFIVHDVLVHQRLKLLRNTKNKYFLAIRRAHKIHHKHLKKENGESFGFLFVSRKYFKQDKNSLLDRSRN